MTSIQALLSHSLLGPSTMPSIITFSNRSSFILCICLHNCTFLFLMVVTISSTICTRFLISSLVPKWNHFTLNNLLQHFISNACSLRSSSFSKFRVSQAYGNTLKTQSRSGCCLVPKLKSPASHNMFKPSQYSIHLPFQSFGENHRE